MSIFSDRNLYLEELDAVLQIGGKIALITFPKLRKAPIIPGDDVTAGSSFASALKLIIGSAIAHRVVEAYLFTWLNQAQRYQGDLATQPGVWVTTVIKIISRFRRANWSKVKIFVNL